MSLDCFGNREVRVIAKLPDRQVTILVLMPTPHPAAPKEGVTFRRVVPSCARFDQCPIDALGDLSCRVALRKRHEHLIERWPIQRLERGHCSKPSKKRL